jgi:hypothetical protein
MPVERMQALGGLLSSLDGEALEGALQIVHPALGTPADEGGEVELDFDAIGPAALWRLDAYLRERGYDTTGGVGGMVGMEGPDAGGGADGGGGGGGGGWGDDSSDSE